MQLHIIHYCMTYIVYYVSTTSIESMYSPVLNACTVTHTVPSGFFWVSNTCLRTIKVMQCYYEYIGAMYHVHFCMHTIIHNIDNVGIYVCV